MMQRICCLLNYLSILIKDLLCNTNSFEIIVTALLRQNLVNSTNSAINTSHYTRENYDCIGYCAPAAAAN